MTPVQALWALAILFAGLGVVCAVRAYRIVENDPRGTGLRLLWAMLCFFAAVGLLAYGVLFGIVRFG